ncbi:MAG: sugar transferase [Pedobacter sp.]
MYSKYLKRFFDILLSILLLPIFVFLYLIVGIGIKLEDGGSVIFAGERLGKNQKKFKMYKFRSMKINSKDIRNKDGSTYNAKDDHRVTKIGKYIRESSIDEIPQIINVLKGEMSFVGPRPSPTGNEHLYSKDYLRKFSVRPGVTGYTQVYFRNNCTIEERQKNDLFYVDNLTMMLDVKIIFLTFYKVFRREDLYRENSDIKR